MHYDAHFILSQLTMTSHDRNGRVCTSLKGQSVKRTRFTNVKCNHSAQQHAWFLRVLSRGSILLICVRLLFQLS